MVYTLTFTTRIYPLISNDFELKRNWAARRNGTLMKGVGGTDGVFIFSGFIPLLFSLDIIYLAWHMGKHCIEK